MASTSSLVGDVRIDGCDESSGALKSPGFGVSCLEILPSHFGMLDA